MTNNTFPTSSGMDPRRVPELSLAAARGAARKAASDARQSSIRQAIMQAREASSGPDVEMLDAPPLEYSRSSLYGRGNSLPHSESLTSSHLPAASSQRQLSGDMASTSYLQPVHVIGVQHGSSSAAQPSSPYIIEVDDDSPLPMRRRPQATTLCNSRHCCCSSNLHSQNSGNLVDLTGETPSSAQLPVRHPIDLDSIGSGSLGRTSSELGQQPSVLRQQQAQRSGPRRPAGNSASARSLCANMGASQSGRLGVYANGSSSAADSIYNEAGDFLDITGLQSSQHGSFGRSPSRQPAHRSTVVSSQGRGDLEAMHQQRESRAMSNQSHAHLYGNVSFEARQGAATQEDIDLALAMSLAAEDDEEGRFHPMDPAMSRHFSNNRHRQQHTRSEASFFQPYSSRAGPLASIAHSFLSGGSHLDQEVLATLMADFDRAANAGSTAPGSGQQDLSYEALTNLEDVKLTAPPELLATMPLDMCLKGGQWEDKACSICQSEYEPDEVIMILPCEHHFHKDCAMEWLGKHSKKCPICKELIGG